MHDLINRIKSYNYAFMLFIINDFLFQQNIQQSTLYYRLSVSQSPTRNHKSQPSLPSVHNSTEYNQYLHQITKRIFTMPFPTDDITKPLSRTLNQLFGYNYIIYNLSEHKYNPEPFNNQVIDFVFPGFPCPSLENIFIILKELDAWLATDEKHVAILHCQPTMGRSMMILSSYIALTHTEFTHPSEVRQYLCDRLKLSQDLLNPSQIRYLNYTADILGGYKVCYSLAKINYAFSR